MNSERFTVRIPKAETIRADKFAASLGLFSRSQIARRAVRVRLTNGRKMKMSGKLRDGDSVVVDWDDPEPSEIHPEPLELEIVHEDDDCVVVDKAQGIVVHPAAGHLHGTLVQGLLHRYSRLEEVFGGDRVRPGIVHRLDKDTSGLIIAAKNPTALECLARQFREGTVEKSYLTLTRGIPPAAAGDIDRPIGRDPGDRKKFAVDVPNAKNALSRFTVWDSSSDCALVLVNILTGRTHQIRVHMRSVGCPVIGDPIYGRKDPRFPDATLMLHSWKLALRLPSGEAGRFTASVPDRIRDLSQRLGLKIGPADR